MKWRRTIVETIVYTEEVEAESREEAYKAPIHVKTGISVPGNSYPRAVEKLLVKSAAVAAVEEQK